MNEARYASLSSGLLARKGAAKPAMRPQSFASIEDLGWNDMGFGNQPEAPFEAELPEHVPSSIAALTPAPRAVRPESDPASVVAQQQAIAESFQAEEEEVPAAEAKLPRKGHTKAQVVTLPKRRAVPAGKKAAFTLRLDSERHLRLRLACAVTGRSAQQLVTRALDDLLQTLPEVEVMAERVPAGVSRS
jgi:hypothetical protein